MARLDITPDATAGFGGGLVVSSDNASVLAAVPDALVQSLGLMQETATCWTLHPSEQTGLRDSAYVNERTELGPAARAQVIEMVRPRQQHVVWVDRYHFVASFQQPAVLSRLLGLYVGGQGALLAYVHPAASTHTFEQVVVNAPQDSAHGWNQPQLIGQARFAVRYDGRSAGQLWLAFPGVLHPPVQQALQQLSQLVADW